MQITGPIFPTSNSGVPNHLFRIGTINIPIGVFSGLPGGVSPSPPNNILLEDNVSDILLEDSTSFLLMES